MTAARIHLRPLSALLAIGLIAADVALAQVPEGAAVVGTQTTTGIHYVPGTPGLFFVPLAGGAVVRVTGLPAELATDGFNAFAQGIASVALRTSDGAVIVGTTTTGSAPSAGAVKVFVFHLNGAAVDPALTQQIVVGQTVGTGPGRASVAVLPDGRLLVVASEAGLPLQSGAMAGRFLAIVDIAGPSPVFTLLPNPTGLPLPRILGGLAADPTGRFVYFVLSTLTHQAPTIATLHRLELATSQQCQIASWPGESAFGIACDDAGTVYLSSTNPTLVQHAIHTIRPNGCSPAVVTTVVSSLPLLAFGLDLDRASGRFAALSGENLPPFAGPQLNTLSLIDPVPSPATAAVTVVTQPPAGGWGNIPPYALAVNNTIESYGPVTDGLNRYTFANFPNPGGQPTLGNAGFTLTMRSAPGVPLLSVLALSLGRGSLQALGIEVLVDLTTMVLVSVPSGASVSYALPIPNNPSLAGFVLTAQSVHLESTGAFRSSRGLEVRIQ